ncbi:hypothetical protein DQ04_09781010 [Trypanosoma grayi]|uniref:hypothetical protein n=1 Tax=Trypanosoma grayi TaxID=71804 RepID=UPI0004F46C31|nr:hypothetical protein DQ04_09781010 [Trypanosoma grayi]KEG07444.1 hypothetical protein DQ04_09781010 [Trypanosoma grayi]
MRRRPVPWSSSMMSWARRPRSCSSCERRTKRCVAVMRRRPVPWRRRMRGCRTRLRRTRSCERRMRSCGRTTRGGSVRLTFAWRPRRRTTGAIWATTAMRSFCRRGRRRCGLLLLPMPRTRAAW